MVKLATLSSNKFSSLHGLTRICLMGVRSPLGLSSTSGRRLITLRRGMVVNDHPNGQRLASNISCNSSWR